MTKALDGQEGDGMDEYDGVEWVEGRLTSERKVRVFAMNKSRAKIVKRLTNSMLDAERDIERAYRYKISGNGYPSGGEGGAAEGFYRERDIQLYLELNTWLDDCNDDWSNVVIDMAVHGSSARRLSQIKGCSPNTVLDWFCKGLNEYCVQRGWGDQINI